MVGEGMERWAGRVAVVTGASGGIGRATAERLVAAGMKVAVGARRYERLEALAEGREDAVLPVRLDMRDEGSILGLFDAVRARWGGADVLVNNAGLGHASSLLTGATEDWREMLEVNVLGLTIATREAIADMRRRGDDGHVFHVSSMAGHRVPPGSGVYAATKHAVRALTEGLRRELRDVGSDVRVTAVSPGFVETGFHAVYFGDEDRAAEAYARFPCLQPEDVAGAIVYALGQPPHVQLHDLLMRPTRQPL